MVGFYQWVRPVLRMMLGDPRPHLPVVEATAWEDIGKRPGRAWLERVSLERDGEGELRARRTGTQSSGVLSSMSKAHGLLLLSRASTGVQAGQRVRVMVLDWSFLSGSEPRYGW
jgi:molybdopterin molybdotransferase